MSKYYAFWRMGYLNSWVDATKLAAARDKGLITSDEYNAIIAEKAAQ